jgi:hypothetical protein
MCFALSHILTAVDPLNFQLSFPKFCVEHSTLQYTGEDLLPTLLLSSQRTSVIYFYIEKLTMLYKTTLTCMQQSDACPDCKQHTNSSSRQTANKFLSYHFHEECLFKSFSFLSMSFVFFQYGCYDLIASIGSRAPIIYIFSLGFIY